MNAHGPAVPRYGVREARRLLPQLLRRAAGGERLVITVDGEPLAQLGPLGGSGDRPSLDDLAAAGLVRSPQRVDGAGPPPAAEIPVDVRIDRALDDLRG